MGRIQAQTQVARGSKAMKRPASQKRPATSLQKTASKRGKKDEQVEQEGEEEEPKEEDEEEEEQKSKRLPLTQKALKDHQAFLTEASKLSTEQFDKAFAKLPEQQQQSLWKRFEGSRKSVGRDEGTSKRQLAQDPNSGRNTCLGLGVWMEANALRGTGKPLPASLWIRSMEWRRHG